MHKSILFAIAGAGLVLTGCNATNHRYQTIPVDNPEPAVQPPAPRRPASQVQTPAPTPLAAETPAPRLQVPAPQRQYTPMTGAVSSGGVDSTPSRGAASLSDGGSGASTAQGGTHTVKRGENPATIARKYGVSLSALMAANNLTAESAKKLRIGQKLIIPARSSAPAGRDSRVSSSSDNAPAVGNGQHRVRQGETPEVIARRYKVSVRALMAANNLTEESARRLQIGQILNIPGQTGSAPAPAPRADNSSSAPAASPAASGVQTPAAAPAPAPATDPLLMETELLDITENTTYAAVAARFGIPEATLRALNGGTTENVIPKGGVILVPKR